MSRYYMDEYGNYGETTAAELPDSVTELDYEEYVEAIAALVAADEARKAEEEARKEAERQAAEAERQRQEQERREREAREAAERAEWERLVSIYTNKVKCGDMSLNDVPEDYRYEVEERLNPNKTLEDRVTELENPTQVKYSTVKHVVANTWVSALSESVDIGNYQVVTGADSFKAYCKGVVIGTENPVFVEEAGVLSIQVTSQTTGDYIVKLYKI